MVTLAACVTPVRCTNSCPSPRSRTGLKISPAGGTIRTVTRVPVRHPRGISIFNRALPPPCAKAVAAAPNPKASTSRAVKRLGTARRYWTRQRSSSLQSGVSDSFAIFLVRRAFAAVLITVAVAAITFLILRLLAPWGFDETSPLVAVARYLRDVFLHGDLGISRQRPFQPVLTVLREALPADLALFVGAMIAGLGLGIYGGVVCVRRRGTWVARLLEGLAALFLCAPVYFVALMVLFLFAPAIHPPLPLFFVAPNAYRGLTDDPLLWLRALFVPWIIAGLPLASMCLRMVRATMPEALEEDFVRTARAKGVPQKRIAVRHALPLALAPTFSLAGAYAPTLLANVILVEAVFGIPGMYRLMPGAMDNANFPLLMGIVIIGSVFVVICNALADITLAAIDPRVRM
jgi:peptide/nickel transport system permease protein